MYTITVGDIVKAIKQLKSGKSNGCEGIIADHIINGTPRLNIMLSHVYNALIVHWVNKMVTLLMRDNGSMHDNAKHW